MTTNPDPPAARLGGKRVLIIEDEYLIAEDMRTAISALGAEVIGPFSDVGDARAFAISLDLDLALVDINVRDGRSFPLIDVLLEQEVPILLVTGYAREALPQQYQTIPILTKPAPEDTIASACTALLQKRSLLGSGPSDVRGGL